MHDHDVETYLENVMYGARLQLTHNKKEILLKALKDQEFAKKWQTNPEVRRGYELSADILPSKGSK